ncbi:MAG: rRNA maturation RNase YbeY [Chloroflexota bacterium]
MTAKVHTMLQISLSKEGIADTILSESEISHVVYTALSDVTESSVDILLTDDKHLRELNQRFMGVDAATDVLAFPAGNEWVTEAEMRHLGDIAISVPRAVAQSDTMEHSAKDEITVLLVHGCLHLLGYDHTEENDRKSMWSVQSEILDQLSVPESVRPQ